MTHYNLVSKNKTRSWIVVIVFVLFIGLASYLMAMGFGFGFDIVGLALIFSGVLSLGSYWYSDKIILGISGAKPATKDKYFDFYTVTENLIIGERMPMPKLYVIEDSAMNAFATGRDPKHGVVCATTGLLSRLNRSEIEAVVAHELSHIQNYDIRLMSLVSILVGFVALLGDWMLHASAFGGNNNEQKSGQLQVVFLVAGIATAILAPIIAELIKLAISRKREFLADASAVAMTKNPQGMINALSKIGGDKEPLEAANKATAHLYFSNPLSNVHSAVGMFAGMFNTHPPLKDRIKALQSL